MGLLKGGYRRVVFVVAALTIEGLAVYVDSLSTSVYTLNISTFAIYSQTQKSPSPFNNDIVNYVPYGTAIAAIPYFFLARRT